LAGEVGPNKERGLGALVKAPPPSRLYLAPGLS